MSINYKYKDQDIKLCLGLDKDNKCIHRFRCYRFSLAQDALFKGMNFNAIDVNTCLNPEDENIMGFKDMWLPNNTPTY